MSTTQGTPLLLAAGGAVGFGAGGMAVLVPVTTFAPDQHRLPIGRRAVMDGDWDPSVAVGGTGALPTCRWRAGAGFDTDLEPVAALGDVGDVEAGQTQLSIAIDAVGITGWTGNGRVGEQGSGLSGVQRLCGNSHRTWA